MSQSPSTPAKPAFQDLFGRTFGMLEVVGPSYTKNWRRFWPCRCACGVEKDVSASDLLGDNTKSCGCGKSVLISKKITKHGGGTRRGRYAAEYGIWRAMLNRCFNKNVPGYKDYGARGITVCDRWRHSFEAFLADVGPRPSPEMELDRENNDGNYEPGNVRWVTAAKNCRNRRTCHLVTAFGQTKTVIEWAEEKGLRPKCLYKRLSDGWSPEEAIATPSRRATAQGPLETPT